MLRTSFTNVIANADCTVLLPLVLFSIFMKMLKRTRKQHLEQTNLALTGPNLGKQNTCFVLFPFPFGGLEGKAVINVTCGSKILFSQMFKS